MIGQQVCKLHGLILIGIEPGEIGRYLLETEHVGVGDLFCHGNDPRKIGHAVATLSALDIPGQ